MNGELGKTGILFIERKEVFVAMECKEGGGGTCSDHCALFGEPEIVSVTKIKPLGRGSQEEIIEETAINLCCKTVQFENFEDNRISQK